MPEGFARPRSVPRLRFRPMFQRDVAAPWLDLTAAQRQALPDLWSWLVDEPSMVTGVNEDMALPVGERIQGWGVTLALPPARVDRLAPAGRVDPHAGATAASRVYAALLDRSFVPMTERELGEANARGTLAFLVLHYRLRRHDLSDPYALNVLTVANESFRMFHAGYQVAAFYHQAAVADESFVISAGFPRCHEPVPGQPAALYGLSREQARGVMPGTSLRHVFNHLPPMFRLSSSQRRLLWLALFDESDEALMPLLDVSVHGLKKLWRGIYERIGDVDPEFFGDASSDDDGKRGPEKRRQVLAYVRQRPEELRPWSP